MKDLALVEKIARAVADVNGRAYFVGGYARDTIFRQMGRSAPSKDIDIEVYGIPIQQLQLLLQQFGVINTVGAQFGVIKLANTDIDISIPRRDSKIGVGHKGFLVDTDPHMPLHEAAQRRDFTINSLAIDILTGEVIDEHGAINDIKNGVLRATDAQRFVDDPLRVLRAMQLAARFDLHIDPATEALCQTIDLSQLPAERIGEEWRKLLLRAERPSIGLAIAQRVGVLDKLHPELATLATTPQDPKWHPEGNVWTHTEMAVNVAAQIIRRERLDDKQALTIMLGTLCHDIGKATTTQLHGGKVTSHGHDTAGAIPTRAFLAQLALPHYYHQVIPLLVVNHMFPTLHPSPSNTSIRRLAYRLAPATIEQLVWLSEADVLGRSAPPADVSYLRTLLDQSKQLDVARHKPEPLVLGRDLMALGVKPGPKMGALLARLFDDQLSGAFHDTASGIEHARTILGQTPDKK